MNNPVEKKFNNISKRTFYTVRIGILAALAFILMLFEFPVTALFPEFLKFDVSGVPVIIGTFSMGPLSGLAIQFIKNALHLFANSSTKGVGQLADFMASSTFILVSGFIYKHNRTRKGAAIAMTAGTAVTVAVATILNYFLFIPLFEIVLNFPLERIIEVSSKVNPAVVDLKTYCLLVALPFNLIKWSAITILTSLIYKKVSAFLRYS